MGPGGRRFLRRAVTFCVVAATTAGGLLFWLHDGDVKAALEEGRSAVRWDADALAREAGIVSRDPASVAPTGEVLRLHGEALRLHGEALRLDEPVGPAAE